MKKLLCILILACGAFLCFAQDVKPYVADLNWLPAVNADKTATFDKATKTVTVTYNDNLEWNQWGGDRGLYLGLNNLDISNYNIARVKYKVLGDYGFNFALDYDDETLDWSNDKTTYCPTYLNEMVIPLKYNQKKLKGIVVAGAWHVRYEQFVIESITFEKIANPQKTDVNACDEPPVIDTAKNGIINEKLVAWDFVKQLGAGLQYMVFIDAPELIDFGMDVHPGNAFSKPTKEQIQFIKSKGFKTIRIQTNPGNDHLMDKDYRINPSYIKHIKQVVDWCIEEDMYVIICGPFAEYGIDEKYKKRVAAGDVHFAGYFVNVNDKKESERFLRAVWKQYAEAFNNSYDEHLIFENLNEPVDVFHVENVHSWFPKDDCSRCKKAYEVLNDYNQLIVDTIRSTGGNNTNRFIMINGLGAKCWTITSKNFKLPKDKSNNKLIPTYHEYTMGGSAAFDQYSDYYTNGIKESILETFATFDKVYFSKHIPVYVSEIGQSRRTPILERIKWIKDFMAEASKPSRSCAALLHVDGALKDDGQFFSGYYDSWKLKWYDEEFVDTFIYGVQGKEYPLSADFAKKNEVKVESIVGKNLLKTPLELKNWEGGYKLTSNVLALATPAKYKLVFEFERKGSDPRFNIGYNDSRVNWHEVVPLLKKSEIKGGVIEGTTIKVKAKSVEISVDEELARQLEYTIGIYPNGKDIIIKSIKVVE